MEREERRGAVTVTQRGWNTGGRRWKKKKNKENEG
jgi:hypothetical protein